MRIARATEKPCLEKPNQTNKKLKTQQKKKKKKKRTGVRRCPIHWSLAIVGCLTWVWGTEVIVSRPVILNFLMLWPFNRILHVVVTPTIKLCLLYFITVICY